jgi:hypothetical protein
MRVCHGQMDSMSSLAEEPIYGTAWMKALVRLPND